MEIDLRQLDGDQVVIHFGGAPSSIDAYTFANALIGFADTVRAVNAVINPGQDIEIRLEAQGPGSYRAVIRKIRKGIGGFFSRGAENLLWAVVGALIYDQLIAHKPEPPRIIVKSDEVVIESDGDRVIVPRAVYEVLPNVRKSEEVRENLRRTFRVIENDEGVGDFGLTRNLDDPKPALMVTRDQFPAIADGSFLSLEETEKTRIREEHVRLVILKAWLTHTNRKWSFEWNGVPISAPIRDEGFLTKIDEREYLIGAGDALDVVLTFRQNFDEALGVYVNDTNSFVVKEVIRPVPRTIQTRL